MKIFITAIGTDCGKTFVSAIFCQALKADYWKPVQTGKIRDAATIQELVSYPVSVHPETFLLKEPVSPHLAAKLENISISLENFRMPELGNHLIIEGAGGLLVPLNDKGEFFLDYLEETDNETVLVIRLYLGCINHALLSINELKSRNLKIKGLVFNGDDSFGAVEIIRSVSGLPVLLHIKEQENITKEVVLNYSNQLDTHE